VEILEKHDARLALSSRGRSHNDAEELAALIRGIGDRRGMLRVRHTESSKKSGSASFEPVIEKEPASPRSSSARPPRSFSSSPNIPRSSSREAGNGKSFPCETPRASCTLRPAPRQRSLELAHRADSCLCRPPPRHRRFAPGHRSPVRAPLRDAVSFATAHESANRRGLGRRRGACAYALRLSENTRSGSVTPFRRNTPRPSSAKNPDERGGRLAHVCFARIGKRLEARRDSHHVTCAV